MLAESALSPAALNSAGCVGLNQICRGNYGVFSPMTESQYLSLTAEQQLPYVFAFWRSVLARYGRGQGFFSGRDLYWLNWVPALFVPRAPDSYVIARRGDAYYNDNTALDVDGNGVITAGDLTRRLETVAGKAAIWPELNRAIDRATAVPPLAIGVSILGGLALGAAAFLATRRSVILHP